MTRLKDKINGARDDLPAPILREEEEGDVGVIYFGSMENTIEEIDDMLEATGLKVSQCRVRSLPIHSEVEAFIRRHKTTIVLEINRDGQLWGILRRELPNDIVGKVHSVAYSDGMPPRARIYSDKILETLKEVNQ
jgi:pyruvate/2-oxoacid:ferredoxin oxidoreductase alpha subunit